MSEVPDCGLSVGTVLFCMVEALVLVDLFPAAALTPAAGPATGAEGAEGAAGAHSGEHSILDGGSSVGPSTQASSPLPSQQSSQYSPQGSVDDASAQTGAQGKRGSVLPAPSPEAVGECEGEREAEPEGEPLPSGALGDASLDYGDWAGLRVAMAEALLSDSADAEGARRKLGGRLLVAVERKAIAALQHPRLVGFGALPLRPALSAAERSIEQSELLSFCDLSPQDISFGLQVSRGRRKAGGGGGGEMGSQRPIIGIFFICRFKINFI